LAGSWTAQTDQTGGATGAWILQDATGKVLMQGGWSASKSAQSWDGAWRANVSGRAGEFSGTWSSATSLSPQSRLADMLERVACGGHRSMEVGPALRLVVDPDINLMDPLALSDECD
jgi:hypothetical protein